MKTFIVKVLCGIGFLILLVTGERQAGYEGYESKASGYPPGYGRTAADDFFPDYANGGDDLKPVFEDTLGDVSHGYASELGGIGSYGGQNLGVPTSIFSYYASMGIIPIDDGSSCSCPYELQRYQHRYNQEEFNTHGLRRNGDVPHLLDRANFEDNLGSGKHKVPTGSENRADKSK